MGRYIGPKCRLERRAGMSLALKSGEKTHRKNPPGMHGQKRIRQSDYGLQLSMKQNIRRFYGVSEKKLRSYYQRAERMKGVAGDNFLFLLESRLDNVVYRMGFAATRAEARQLVSHKAILVNGAVLNIPSAELKIGDVVSIRDKAKKQLRITAALELASQREMVSWLAVDQDALSGTWMSEPNALELPQDFKVNLVIEYYSK